MTPRRSLVTTLIILLIFAAISFVVNVVIQDYASHLKVVQPYLKDLELGFNATIVGVGGYIVIRLIKLAVENYMATRTDNVAIRSVTLLLDLFLYTLLVIAVLSALGVNLTGAAIGGAVGGVAVGLAAQTVLSNVLSGLMVTSSRTLRPGDAVILQSWIWSPPIVGETEKVSLLYTEVRTVSGNVVRVPNSAFLGNTVFTKLSAEDGFSYPYELTINADVPADRLLEKARDYVRESLSKEKYPLPEITFYSKNGSTNVFLVTIKIPELQKLRRVLDTINASFERAYWELKSG